MKFKVEKHDDLLIRVRNWFAWYPVRNEDRDIVWLETVKVVEWWRFNRWEFRRIATNNPRLGYHYQSTDKGWLEHQEKMELAWKLWDEDKSNPVPMNYRPGDVDYRERKDK